MKSEQTSTVFDYPSRPLRHEEVTLLVDHETGEVLGFRGLNEDQERCPAASCGDCAKRCICAPCACSECVSRAAWAARPAPPRKTFGQMVLV